MYRTKVGVDLAKEVIQVCWLRFAPLHILANNS